MPPSGQRETPPRYHGRGNPQTQPLERDPELVLSDVLDDFTTLEPAERGHGVVIDPDSMTVDAAATEARRAAR